MGYCVKQKTVWITKTAALIALLVVLQAVTKPLGQAVTGSCVNAVLAVAALLMGTASGLSVALVSPIFACLLGIAPNPLVVPVIMLGNAVFVLLLRLLAERPLWKGIIAVAVSAMAKFGVMYALVSCLICGVAADMLLTQGILKQPMLTELPAAFSWLQLVTALIGGTVAMLIVPVLKKALRSK